MAVNKKNWKSGKKISQSYKTGKAIIIQVKATKILPGAFMSLSFVYLGLYLDFLYFLFSALHVAPTDVLLTLLNIPKQVFTSLATLNLTHSLYTRGQAFCIVE